MEVKHNPTGVVAKKYLFQPEEKPRYSRLEISKL